MAQKEIEQWARILQESEAQDQAYENACNDTLKEMDDAINDVELGDEDEVIDPASVGFVDSEALDEDDSSEDQSQEQIDETEDEEVDLAECGFTDDGEELAVKEAEEDLNEAWNDDERYASIELDVEGTEEVSGDDMSFEDALHAEVPEVSVKKSGIGVGGTCKYRLSGFLRDLKEAYAFYLGLYSWNDVVKQGEESAFNDLVVFEDGDTLQEADYREALAHVFDPIGVKASTANLKKNNVCQLSLVKEAVKKEIAARKMRKAICEADVSDLSDEELEGLEATLDLGDAVDNGYADKQQEKAWLYILKGLGINSMEEYRAMDQEEFDRRFEASLKPPFEQANGFRKSDKVFRAYHRPDNENGGATYTDFQFNPEYYHRVTRAEAERNAKRAEKIARDAMPIEFPKRGTRDEAGKKGTWTLAEFGKLLYSLGPKRAKELKKAMLEIAHEDNIDDPEAEAYEKMFIERLFGKKAPTFRDIASAWYPGQDPNTRQQSVNKFFQDTLGNFQVAVRRASGGTDGGREAFSRKILGNEGNFKKFLDIMKQTSEQRAKNKRSIINKGKKPEDSEETPASPETADASSSTEAK